eukprot:3728814-Alexandrium_andersonii.AAC.1
MVVPLQSSANTVLDEPELDEGGSPPLPSGRLKALRSASRVWPWECRFWPRGATWVSPAQLGWLVTVRPLDG